MEPPVAGALRSPAAVARGEGVRRGDLRGLRCHACRPGLGMVPLVRRRRGQRGRPGRGPVLPRDARPGLRPAERAPRGDPRHPADPRTARRLVGHRRCLRRSRLDGRRRRGDRRRPVGHHGVPPVHEHRRAGSRAHRVATCIAHRRAARIRCSRAAALVESHAPDDRGARSSALRPRRPGQGGDHHREPKRQLGAIRASDTGRRRAGLSPPPAHRAVFHRVLPAAAVAGRRARRDHGRRHHVDRRHRPRR